MAGKFQSLRDDVFSVFASAPWVAENIKTFPDNYVTNGNQGEFVRVSVIPGGNGINAKSVSGILVLDIFIAAGEGPSRAFLIADKLDQYLVYKTVQTDAGGSTQFFKSALAPSGLDPSTRTLYRYSYTIPFTYFGVL